MIFLLGIALLLTTWRYATLIRSLGWREGLVNFLSALSAGIVAGLVFGVCARIAMRLLALGMDAPLRWTASGSFAVVIIFAGLGLGLTFPYATIFRNSSRGHPMLFAIALSLVTLVPFIRAAAQDLVASPWESRVIIGGTLVTLLLWFPYAAILEQTFRRIYPRLQKWLPAATPQIAPC